MMDATAADPKGLMREAYRIDGITEAECGSILIDWALSLPQGTDTAAALRAVLAHHGAGQEGHPMTVVLSAGLDAAAAPRRRGGRAARVTAGRTA